MQHNGQPKHKIQQDAGFGESWRDVPPISLSELSIQEMDRELIARGIQLNPEKRFIFPDGPDIPQRTELMTRIREMYEKYAHLRPDSQLRHISDELLIQTLKRRIEIESSARGIYGLDDRRDPYDVDDSSIKKNIRAVAAVCHETSLIENGNYCTLKVKPFREVYSVSKHEPFNGQPASEGFMCTGFLYSSDSIITAGHAVNPGSWKRLRVVFGYQLDAPDRFEIRIPKADIYTPVELKDFKYSRTATHDDWAEIRLDRDVSGRTPVTLNLDPLKEEQAVYILGYPLGLPLKYAPGASIKSVAPFSFASDLDVYSGNSGSPVFDAVTHNVIGMVVKGTSLDFRWVGDGYISICYTDDSKPSNMSQSRAMLKTDNTNLPGAIRLDRFQKTRPQDDM